MPNSERRRTFRFSFRLSCRVFSPYHNFSEFAGITENVSRYGILVRLTNATPDKRLPMIGSSARILVDLPSDKGRPPKYLDCEGAVVRVGELVEGERELGFRVRRMQFRDRESAARLLLLAAGGTAMLKFAM
jgi:c-di-GMP-binding flagellar brake protein YcgR